MIAPDETTFEYLRGRPMAPFGAEFDKAVENWKKLPSDEGSKYVSLGLCCYECCKVIHH